MTDGIASDPPPEAPRGRLAGRVVLVTGGTRGIGEAVVRLFAAEGASVAFCSRRADEGARLEAELVATGRRVRHVRADVASESGVRELVRATVGSFGRLDVVVNAAGITAAGPVEELSLETWVAVLNANLTSMFLVCREAIPHLRSAGGGSIINLGSTYGVVGAAGSAAYAVTKAGAINLSRSLALELAADGIRVNALCPGATATPMNLEWLAAQADPDAALAQLVAKHPMGRMSTPEEQARAALFLATEESSFVTGHALLVDGGYTAI